MIGLDIGGTKCAALMARVGGGIEIFKRLEFPTETGKGFEHAKGRLFECVRELMGEFKMGAGEIAAIGVSCGGPLDPRRGLVMSPPHLPGWDDIPLPAMLEEEFGIEAHIQNDANACALVEWRMGAGRGFDNIVFLTMGTGIGGGIITHGVLIEGASGMGGEVGHLRIENDGPVGFGKAGSLEGYCSGENIGKLAGAMTREWVAGGREPAWTRDGHAPESLSAKLIAQYANAGDEDARAIYRFVGEKLGKAISILIDTLNPERVVIGSIFARSGHLLRESMDRVIDEETIPHSRAVCKVVPAETGERIGDYASIMAACYRMGIDPLQ